MGKLELAGVSLTSLSIHNSSVLGWSSLSCKLTDKAIKKPEYSLQAPTNLKKAPIKPLPSSNNLEALEMAKREVKM